MNIFLKSYVSSLEIIGSFYFIIICTLRTLADDYRMLSCFNKYFVADRVSALQHHHHHNVIYHKKKLRAQHFITTTQNFVT